MAFRTGPKNTSIVGAAGSHLKIAVSSDLYHWERHPSVPVFSDFCQARDPMLLKHEGEWVMFYVRCKDILTQTQGVAFRRSHDLLSWTEPEMALVTEEFAPQRNSGCTESPFVFFVNGSYYLSV